MFDPIGQVRPARIVFLDQFELPGPFPFLHPRLALSRIVDIVVSFEPDEQATYVFLGETGDSTAALLEEPSCQIACDTEVDRAVAPVRQDVDPARFRRNSPP